MALTPEQCAILYESLNNLLNAHGQLIQELSGNADDDPNNDQLLSAIKKLSNDIRKLARLINDKCDPANGNGEGS